jgi:hypothetical protein
MAPVFEGKVRLICQQTFKDDYLALELEESQEVLIRIPMQVIFDCLTDYESYCQSIVEVEEVS